MNNKVQQGQNGDYNHIKYDIKRLVTLLKRDELRLQDDAWFGHLVELMSVCNDAYIDSYLAEILNQHVEARELQAQLSNDPFLGKYPPKGSIELNENAVIVGGMPTNDPIIFPDGRRTGNTVLCGPTGQAKTSGLEFALPQIALGSRVVAFDRKKRLRHLAALPFLAKHAVVLDFEELMLAMLEYAPGVEDEVGNIDIVDQIARSYNLFASRRILLGSLDRYCWKKPRGERHLGGWVGELQAFQPGKGFREAGYKEASFWVLHTLNRSTMGVLDYLQSDFLEKLFDGTGLVVIEAPKVPAEHLSFVWSYISRWIYTKRRYEK